MMITLPASLGIAALADVLVPTILGDAWLGAIPLMKVVAVYGALFSLTSNCAYVILAIGQPRLATRIALWELALTIPGIYIGIKWMGLIGVPMALLTTVTLVSVPLWWTTVGRALNMSISKLLGSVWRPTFAAMAMYAVVVTFVSAARSFGLEDHTTMMLGFLVGVITYPPILFTLWRATGSQPGGEQIAFDALRTRSFGGIPGISN
jgi:lipopolysaccharide exporter